MEPRSHGHAVFGIILNDYRISRSIGSCLRLLFGAQLRRGNERHEAAPEHLLASSPQSLVARGGRQAKALGDGLTFLVHPNYSRSPPRDIRLKGLDQCGFPAQTLGEHPSVFHRHAAALAHHRRARVGGVTNQNHPTPMPFLERNPVNRSAMDLLVALQRREIFLDDLAEAGEVAAQAVEPAGHRLGSAGLGDVAKTIGASVAYRAEPEEATLAQEEL